MRIALIILSILSLMLIWSISWSLMNQEWWKVRMPSLPNPITSTTEQAWTDSLALETWKNQVKTEEKLEKLTAMVEELAKKNGTYSQEVNQNSVSSTPAQAKVIVKPSWKLLALIMPTITPVLDNNNWIFGLYIFDTNVNYSTYKDNAYALTIIPTEASYDGLLANIRALNGNPFRANETKNFPFRSFFLNPTTSDSLVRIVVEIENQAIALEVSKSKYDVLKALLLWKQIPVTTNTISTPKSPTVIVPPQAPTTNQNTPIR